MTPRSWDQADAEALRVWRESFGLSQAALAELLGLSDPDRGGAITVGRWERLTQAPAPYLWPALRELERELKRRRAKP